MSTDTQEWLAARDATGHSEHPLDCGCRRCLRDIVNDICWEEEE